MGGQLGTEPHHGRGQLCSPPLSIKHPSKHVACCSHLGSDFLAWLSPALPLSFSIGMIKYSSYGKVVFQLKLKCLEMEPFSLKKKKSLFLLGKQ